MRITHNEKPISTDNPLPVDAAVALTSADVVTVTGGAGQTADVKVTMDSEKITTGSVQTSRAVELLTGESITLAASGARTATAGTNGTAAAVNGERFAYIVLCEFTAKATEVDDTCDVYVDVLVGATWINAIHFTQALGNGTDAAKEYAILCPSGSNVTVTVATADLASGAVRGDAFGSQIRARWVIVDGGGDAASFTFAVTAYAL